MVVTCITTVVRFSWGLKKKILIFCMSGRTKAEFLYTEVSIKSKDCRQQLHSLYLVKSVSRLLINLQDTVMGFSRIRDVCCTIVGLSLLIFSPSGKCGILFFCGRWNVRSFNPRHPLSYYLLKPRLCSVSSLNL